MFQFYNKNDGVRVTDLHQGIVWGTNTEQTNRDPALINRFDYDSDYGTVLNRFLMQSAVCPLFLCRFVVNKCYPLSLP
jgi:UDP-sulfoquinovose synthase